MVKSLSLIFCLATLIIFFQNFTQINVPDASGFSYITANEISGLKSTVSNQVKIKDVPFAIKTGVSPCSDAVPTCLDIIHHSTDSRPLVIFVHGGGWKSGTYKGHIDQLGQTFYKAGYAFASVGYRLYPQVQLLDIARDVAAAVALLQKRTSQYNLNGSIIIMGHSAGAHLAALVNSHPSLLEDAQAIRSQLNGVILLDGSVYDFPSLEGKQDGTLTHATSNKLLWNELSPTYNITQSNVMPPTFIASDIERDVDILGHYPGTGKQANLLKKSLQKKNSPLVFRQFQNKNHADYYHDLQNPEDELIKEVIKFSFFVQPQRFLEASSVESNHLLSSVIFDWRVYSVKNAPSSNIAGMDRNAAEKKWINQGSVDGSAGHSNFDVKILLNNYQKLKNVFNTDYKKANVYFSKYGYWLGYRGVPSTAIFGGLLPPDKGTTAGGNAIIGNNKIRLVTSAKYAGAVTELWYNNKQLVNSGARGFGRLFQIAAWKYGQGPCYNPIEAGGRYLADRGETTKTVIHKFDVADGFLETLVTPSLFRKRGEDNSICASMPTYDPSLLPAFNQDLDNDIKFGKIITLNAFDNPNIIKFEVLLKSSKLVPNFIFQLYAALNSDMNQIYTIDLPQCVQQPNNPCLLRLRTELTSSKYSQQYPTILSSKEDNFAFALYSPMQALGVNGTYSAEFRSDDVDKGTTDTAVSFSASSILANEEVRVPIYVFVGPISLVQKSYVKTVKLFNK